MRVRRLEKAIESVRDFSRVWLEYGKLIESARKAGRTSAEQEGEFSKTTQALVKHYRSCLRLMENADLPGHHVIWRSLQSGALADIIAMPEGPFAKYWRDWQGGYKTLQEFLAFLQSSRLDLLETPWWRYYLGLVTGSRPVRVAAVVLVLAAAVAGLGRFGALDFATQQARVVEVVRILGRVQVQGQGKTLWRELMQGEKVVPGDTIRCGPEGLVDLKSDDATTLRIEPGSELHIERSLLSRLTSFRTLAVRLLHGKVYVVARQTERGREITVHTAEGLSRIGREPTTAAVAHTEDEGTSATVYDGEMALVSPLQRALMLRANERADIQQQQLSEAAEPVPDDEAQAGKALVAAIEGDLAPLVEHEFERARLLRSHGQTREALAAFKKVIALDPLHMLAHIGYQSVAREMGKGYALIDEYRALADRAPGSAVLQCACGFAEVDPAQRQQRCDRALEIDPDGYWAHVLRGDLLLRECRWDDALKAFDQARALDPNEPAAYHRLARVRRAMGNWDQAEALAQELTTIHPDKAETWCDLGAEFSRSAKRKQAKAAYMKALEVDPKHVDAAYRLAVGLYESPTWLRDALEWTERTLVLDPDSLSMRSRILHHFGCYWRTSQTKQIMAAAEQIVKDWPENYRAWEAVGEMYYDARFYCSSHDLRGLKPEELDWAKLSEDALLKAKSIEPRATSVHVKLAHLYAGLRQYDRALAVLREAGKLMPWDGTPYVEMGDLLRDRKSSYFHEEAERSYDEARRRNPRIVGAIEGLYRLYDVQGRRLHQKQLLEQALKADPYSRTALRLAHRFYRDKLHDDTRAQEFLARLDQVDPYEARVRKITDCLAAKQYDQGIQMMKEFLAQNPTSYVWMQMASAYRALGQPDKAAAAVEGYVRTLGEHPWVEVVRARDCRAQGRVDDAIVHYRKAFEANPFYASAAGMLAAMLKKQRRFDDAIAVFQEHYKWTRDPEVLLRIAGVLESQGKHKEAERMAVRAQAEGCIEAHAWLGNFYVRRGKAEKDMKKYEGAIRKSYSQLVKALPGSARAPWRYASVQHRHLRDYRGAIAAYEQGLKANPQHRILWFGLGRARAALRQYDRAAAAFKRAVELDPWNDQMRHEYAYRLWSQHLFKEAAEQWDKACKLKPDIRWLIWRTVAFKELKDYPSMMASAQEALALDANHPGVHFWLGYAYDNGSHDAARTIEHYEKCLALGLKGSGRREAATRIAALKAELVREAERRRLAPYAKFLVAVRERATRLETEAASKVCEAALTDRALQPFLADVKQEQRDFAFAKEALAAACQAAAGPRQMLRLRNGMNLLGRVEAAEGWTLRMTFGTGVVKTFPLQDVSIEQTVELATSDPGLDAHARQLSAIHCFYYLGDFLAADQEIGRSELGPALRERLERKLRLASASVSIQSVPCGAEVRVDGTRLGLTPFVSDRVPAGTRDISVVKPHFGRWSETRALAPGQSMRKQVELFGSLKLAFRDRFDRAETLRRNWRAFGWGGDSAAGPQREQPTGITGEITRGTLRIHGTATIPWGAFLLQRDVDGSFAAADVRIKIVKWSSGSAGGIALNPCPNCAWMERNFNGKWTFHSHPCRKGQKWLLGDMPCEEPEKWHRLRLVRDPARKTLSAYMDYELVGEFHDYVSDKRWRGVLALSVTAKKGHSQDVLFDDLRLFVR